jgi:hypothetical protein
MDCLAYPDVRRSGMRFPIIQSGMAHSHKQHADAGDTTASGDASPANSISKASLNATVLDGATHATEATQSPAKLTVFANRA